MLGRTVSSRLPRAMLSFQEHRLLLSAHQFSLNSVAKRALLSTTATSSPSSRTFVPRVAFPGVTVVPDVVTPEEQAELVKAVNSALMRRPFEKGHYDHVITDYREKEIPVERWPTPEARAILGRLQELVDRTAGSDIQRRPVEWLPPHVIELKAVTGAIDAHVDSIKNSGDIVAGLSLESERSMRLTDEDTGEVKFEMPLRVGSLYILAKDSRFKWAHAVTLGPKRRVSIMFRDAPLPSTWEETFQSKTIEV